MFTLEAVSKLLSHVIQILWKMRSLALIAFFTKRLKLFETYYLVLCSQNDTIASTDMVTQRSSRIEKRQLFASYQQSFMPRCPDARY
jgi:hypothetical protein